ncbi:DMT family transporter [Paracoccus onubensis]|uniref:DMT family transporter n=1 Tax=Paracoccus onubensis TaxID=1675788 RepID=UPI0027319F0F|nr:DMT family transporter [Paracoccus onubensis]MDP0929463.1 DMT family transporter [Paracoccus onubensis]
MSGTKAWPTTDRSPDNPRKRLTGILWAALTVVIFAGWFVVTRFGVTRELGIWDITALRFGVGTVLLGPVLIRQRTTLSFAAWVKGAAFAMLWGAPFVLLVALGLSLTSAAQAASIAPTLMPLFAGIFAWTFLGERQGRQCWIGYVAIFAGLAFLVLTGTTTHGPPNAAGLGALATAAAMWAVYTLLFRDSELTPIESAALICCWSTVLFLPAYLFFGLSRMSHASVNEIALQVIYQGVLMSGVAIITFNRAVSLLGATAATAIIALVPAAASLLAVPVLGETPSRFEFAAIAIIIAGVLLASRRPDMTHPLKPNGDVHDPILFPSDTQSGEDRVASGRSGPALRTGTR